MSKIVGPLIGIKIIEFGGIGPAQFCGMLLADMGADVLRIDRARDDIGVGQDPRFNLMNRSRPTITLNLKDDDDRELLLRLCDNADAVFEGFRPGVMERLRLGPDDCMSRNNKLVYGRMTGWGQEGPLADTVGHDTNYIALTGVLHAIGNSDTPPPIPLNVIGDLGGGGVYLALGLLAAIFEASRSGKGQVVDAAMIDGASSMMTLFYGLLAAGMWTSERNSNVLDGGAPYMQVYATSDGKFMSVCAIESRFYQALLQILDIDEISPTDQNERAQWPAHKNIFAERFANKTRDEWVTIIDGTDACCAPVLTMTEASQHPHNIARKSHVTVDGVLQPAPAPRFSRTHSEIRHGPTRATTDHVGVLSDWGLSGDEIRRLTMDMDLLTR